MTEKSSHFSSAMATKIQECWCHVSHYCNMAQHIFLQGWWKNRIVTHPFLHLSLPKVPSPVFPHANSLTPTVTWSVHGATCQAQLEGSHPSTHHKSGQEPPHIYSHVHELPDGYISRHCLHSLHWELVYFFSLYYICTNICPAGKTCLSRPAEVGSCCPKAETQGIFLDNDPQIHPRLNHLVELSALVLLHIP